MTAAIAHVSKGVEETHVAWVSLRDGVLEALIVREPRPGETPAPAEPTPAEPAPFAVTECPAPPRAAWLALLALPWRPVERAGLVEDASGWLRRGDGLALALRTTIPGPFAHTLLPEGAFVFFVDPQAGLQLRQA